MARRSKELEQVLTSHENSIGNRLFPAMKGDHAQLISYDLHQASQSDYQAIDGTIIDLFTEKYAKRVLTTTWILLDPFDNYPVLEELQPYLPSGSKILSCRIDKRQIRHFGFPEETRKYLE